MYRFITVLALILISQSAFAADIEHITSVKVTTQVIEPDFEQFKQRLGSYSYRVSWQGIPAADVKVSVNKKSQRYQIEAIAKTREISAGKKVPKVFIPTTLRKKVITNAANGRSKSTRNKFWL
jgi:hypothetical protein